MRGFPGFHIEFQEFVASIREGRRPSCTGEDGRAALEGSPSAARAETGRDGRCRSTEESQPVIVDVHTHLPSQVDPVPDDEALYNDVIRPDRPVRMQHGFEDYIRVMEPVDKAIAFGLMPRPGPEEERLAKLGPAYGKGMNDVAAALAARYPEKVIGFMSVHPDAETSWTRWSGASTTSGCGA